VLHKQLFLASKASIHYIKEGRYIQVNGYREKQLIKAYHTVVNEIQIGKYIKSNAAVMLFLRETEIDMSPKLDVQDHVLLGVDFFLKLCYLYG